MDIRDVLERHRTELLALPNVQQVTIGAKTRGGKVAGGPALKVFVSKKIDVSELAEADVVPAELEGFPTDVEAIPELRAR